MGSTGIHHRIHITQRSYTLLYIQINAVRVLLVRWELETCDVISTRSTSLVFSTVSEQFKAGNDCASIDTEATRLNSTIGIAVGVYSVFVLSCVDSGLATV